jgi:predicted DNA binding CopG/RHH family protein
MKRQNIKRSNNMRKKYDLSKSVANPYARRLKQQITIRLERETIYYFKHLADQVDIPYQKLINLYLRDCAEKEMKPSLTWQE